MSLTAFRTLGRSGLVVSPLSLGTMTFGTPQWGSSDDVSEGIFNAYVEGGGNFIDTADVYAKGRSEELIGGYIAERSLRDRLVVATKFSFHGGEKGNPHGGGNGRKNMHRALEGSLRRLKTDYVDLYWMHVWDGITPVEEVLQSLGDLVRAGKIRYFGFSDLPAWYATKAATRATAHSIPGSIALQLEYSLVERSIEREHIPAARECGLGICPWSPLAAGFLAGKYQRVEKVATGEGRLIGANPFGDSKFTDRNWRVLDVLRTVAAQVERPLAQVALAWAAGSARHHVDHPWCQQAGAAPRQPGLAGDSTRRRTAQGARRGQCARLCLPLWDLHAPGESHDLRRDDRRGVEVTAGRSDGQAEIPELR